MRFVTPKKSLGQHFLNDISIAKKIVESNGGMVNSSVSKNTDYVMAGESAGSKLEKAKSVGVKIISENEFLKIA